MVGVEFEARALRRRLRRPRASRGGSTGQAELEIRAVGLGAADLARLEPGWGGTRPAAVIVTGLSGGCAPFVMPGDLVVGESVGPTASGEWLAPDPRLLERARAALGRAGLAYRSGRLLTVPSIQATPADKAECWRRRGALAVDMESAHVLAWARRAGLPAVAVRAVADGPRETLPASLAAAIGSGGELRVRTVLGWLRRPALLGAAWRAWRRSRLALARAARCLTALSRAVAEP